MHDFRYRRGELYCEDVRAAELADRIGTPCYVYSKRTILDHFRKLREAFPGALICYSVKANATLSLLRLMGGAGAGFDVVSGGEIFRVLRAGGDPAKIVFAGVGKRDEEIVYALRHGVFMINVESAEELWVVDEIARREGRRADVALRINPDVDPATHRHITTGKQENKFGVDLRVAIDLLQRARGLANVKIRGLHVHIGSQITSTAPYVETLTRVVEFLPNARAAGHPIDTLDIGGGFGIWYKDRKALPADEMAAAILPLVDRTGCRLVLEPGRFIVGNAGILLSRVLFTKVSGDKRFVICDAGMNDLIRPVLYEAYHRIWPTRTEAGVEGEPPDENGSGGERFKTDLVGPICETGDFFARERPLPALQRGDLVAVFSAGAYGYSMASNYNSHPRPAEALVDGGRFETITERETYEDLIRKERVL
ncbi:MAG TPA: diaminopimelate decarboxylase [Planctomycetota bacterium]|nr:diaminopimelate decarboxylase [Planctomycetota bacterium]